MRRLTVHEAIDLFARTIVLTGSMPGFRLVGVDIENTDPTEKLLSWRSPDFEAR